MLMFFDLEPPLPLTIDTFLRLLLLDLFFLGFSALLFSSFSFLLFSDFEAFDRPLSVVSPLSVEDKISVGSALEGSRVSPSNKVESSSLLVFPGLSGRSDLSEIEP